MPELRTLLAEAKSGLHELEQLLQKARGLSESIPSPSPTREEIQSYFAEILKLVEKIPENLHFDDDPERRQEILRLHREMEVVRERTENSLGQVEITCERNLRHLTDFVETLEQRFSSIAKEKQETPPMSRLSELLSQGKSCLESKDYESCMKLMSDALQVSPQDAEAASCLEEAQRKWEDQRLEEELVIHIENLKRDAIHLFDQEKYSECMGTFKFLCELEPRNRTLQDYLELSKVRLQEIEDGAQISSEDAYASQNSPSQLATVSVPALQSTERTLSNKVGESVEAVEAVSVSNVPAERPDEITPSIATGKLWFISAALTIFIGVGMALLNLRHGSEIRVGVVNVESQPSGATVFIDDEVRGTTPLKVSSLPVGFHKLRLEMQGHTPASQNFSLDTPQPLLLLLTLSPQESIAVPVSVTQLGNEAAELFASGKILDAHRACKELLMLDATNQPALTLKTRIETSLLQEAQLDRRQGKLADAKLQLETLLRLCPQHRGALQEMKRIKTKLKKEPETPPLHDPAETIDEVHGQIASAMAAGRYFPPLAGNAFDLSQRLKRLSPEDPMFRETVHLLQREGMSQLQRKIQVKDTEGARSLLKQLLTYFPDSVEMKGMKESLNTEENRQNEIHQALLQKIDSLISRNNLVYPANENALSFANRILAAEPSNSKVLATKREILVKASEQASEMTRQLKFDEAREILSALLAAATNDGRPVQEIRAKLNRLDFATYPVVHDHALGSCAGHLRVNGYVVEYVPTSESKDGFSERLSAVVQATSGDKLKLQFKSRSYKFQPNSVKDKMEIRQKVGEMERKINEAAGN